MFNKVKRVSPLTDFKPDVQFSEVVTEMHDVKPLFENYLSSATETTIL